MLKRLPLVTTALFFSMVFIGHAQKGKVNRELSHLPPAVQKTIHTTVGTGKLKSIETDNDGGEVFYEVEMMAGGKERGFTVGATGELIDKEVFLGEVPTAVKQTIQKQVHTGTLDEIDEVMDEQPPVYEVSIILAGKTRSFTVGLDGELLEQEVLLSELPAGVQKSVSEQTGKGVLGEIDQSVEAGETNYTAEITRGGKTAHFTLDGTGKLLETEVFFEELSPALQAAIRKQAGTNQLGEIDKTFDDEEISYDVEVTVNSHATTFSFDADGMLFSTDDDIALGEAPTIVQTKIKTMLAGGKLLGLSKITEDGETYYDAEMEVGGKQKTVSIGSDGKVIPDEPIK